jgi:hypothetical protein
MTHVIMRKCPEKILLKVSSAVDVIQFTAAFSVSGQFNSSSNESMQVNPSIEDEGEAADMMNIIPASLEAGDEQIGSVNAYDDNSGNG